MIILHQNYLKKDNFEKPLFSFLPAIAPSMLSNCPKNLQIYYKDFKCLMGLTLKEMSLIIYLLDKESDELITFEKILLDLFDKIQEPFIKHCPKTRKNFLSYSYTLHKFCQLLDKNEFLIYFQNHVL